jgi:riboflavin kinase / FMN adenylyltransferase
LKIFHSARDLQKPPGAKVCLAIGFFDGVHLGHQQIVRQTISNARQHGARSVVVTFDRHPNTVVAPARVPPLIYSLPQKLRAIERLGPDDLLLLHFDKTLSEKTGDSFIRQLAAELGPIHSLCVGANFKFGHKRSGDVSLLKNLGAELGFAVHGLAAVSLDGKTVSSTRIRETLVTGNLDAVSQMLGRAYSFSGKVMEGKKFGHKLGFPTANLDTDGLALPPNGVYAVQATVMISGTSPHSGQMAAASESPVERKGNGFHRGVMNIGTRPTLQETTPKRIAEAHLLDFSGDLYGDEMEITVLEKLRDEKKFADLTELRNQIARDIERAGTGLAR